MKVRLYKQVPDRQLQLLSHLHPPRACDRLHLLQALPPAHGEVLHVPHIADGVDKQVPD
jgi:hypothetical protein